MANIIAVSALNKYVKSLLESDEHLADIAIQGEISNFNRHFKTGHCYFTIKDEKASVKAVMFRTDAQHLAFDPQNGMHVLARCHISLYERDGTFQIYVHNLFSDGVGAAQMAFEQLKQRLADEGLFLEEHKKELPLYPQCIGLVTSKTGAALQDILKVAARRCPTANFLLAPVTVQGVEAAGEIASAMAKLDADKRVDVIVVTRGGGSAEDLWVFNAESIARAAFACETPLVSAVGHEIDFTILDFVADVRAPTPSAAAEMVLPDTQQWMYTLENICTKITNFMQYRLNSCYNELDTVLHSQALKQTANSPLLAAQQLDAAAVELQKCQVACLHNAQNRLQNAAKLAAGLNPYLVLARGYGALSVSGQVVRSTREVKPGQSLLVRMQDGSLDCTIEQITTVEEN